MEKIKIRSIIEIVGKPKEHIEDTMKKVVDLIKSNDKFSLTDQKIAEVKEVKGLWSTFGEFEIIFSSFEDIGTFCFEFMPSSVEILSPEEIKVDSHEIEDFTNDVLAKLHQYDMIAKQMFLQQQTNAQKKDD